MEGVLAGGNRRIDKVLAEDYLAGLSELPMPEVRSLRDEAGQEEADLSYLRRLLQGRIDIVGAAMTRPTGSGEGHLVEDLPRILAEQRQIGSDQRPFVIGDVGQVGGRRRGHDPSSGIPPPAVHNSL